MRVALALLASAVLAAPAGAAEPRTSLPDVEDEVMCVTCRVPLNVAESPQADAQRNEIRRLVDRGLTKEQIKDRLVAEYGPKVLAEPRQRIAWLVPALLAVLALAAVALTVRRWRRAGELRERDEVDRRELDAEDASRLERDMAGYDL